ncbi:DNA glycosylase AlkZ-like family protein [Evansella halocellulosilytica]|uniref:DNA glycosylase AlkZ-like family protein n=1 Tax=Evansella halocellulosilytica TaxID=2011013 RepID=UPI000BB71EDD|nr:crosslink repair DNA glycosylase YcaQ family protein [Evansella halocellulosilytica]
MLKISKRSARQFIIKKLGLFSNYTRDDFHSVLQQLECVQLDPVAIIERNHHLVLMNRIDDYEPEIFGEHLKRKQAFEYFANAACYIPMSDFPIFEAKREKVKKLLEKERHQYKETIRFIFKQLDKHGSLPSKAFQSEAKVVGGWDYPDSAKTKETSHVLSMLFTTGEIQVCGRQGAERYFALTEQAIPQNYLEEAKEISHEEASTRLLHKYLRAYRFIDGTDPRFGWQKMKAAERRESLKILVDKDVLLPVQIEGVDRLYYILTEDKDSLMKLEEQDESLPLSNVSFLPPLDNFLWRRERIEDIFDFTYRWEIYTPAKKRTYGPYSMPVLVGDRLVGRVDPKLDRSKKKLEMTMHYEDNVDRQIVKEQIHHAATRFGQRLHADSIIMKEQG